MPDGLRRDLQFCRRIARRPQHSFGGRIFTDEYYRHTGSARRGPRAKNVRRFRPDLDGRGDGQPAGRQRRVLYRKFAAAAEFALCRVKSRGRVRRPGGPRNIRPRRGHHPLRQQLRPAAISRKADPADDRERDERRAAAGLRRRKNVRDWIYVDDHCRAIWLAYEKGRSGEAYNIGARNERENIEVVRSILDALGKPHDLINFVTDRLGHDRRYAIDPTKAETELGWKPQTTWDEGLEKTIAGTRKISRGSSTSATANIAIITRRCTAGTLGDMKIAYNRRKRDGRPGGGRTLPLDRRRCRRPDAVGPRYRRPRRCYRDDHRTSSRRRYQLRRIYGCRWRRNRTRKRATRRTPTASKTSRTHAARPMPGSLRSRPIMFLTAKSGILYTTGHAEPAGCLCTIKTRGRDTRQDLLREVDHCPFGLDLRQRRDKFSKRDAQICSPKADRSRRSAIHTERRPTPAISHDAFANLPSSICPAPFTLRMPATGRVIWDLQKRYATSADLTGACFEPVSKDDS